MAANDATDAPDAMEASERTARSCHPDSPSTSRPCSALERSANPRLASRWVSSCCACASPLPWQPASAGGEDAPARAEAIRADPASAPESPRGPSATRGLRTCVEEARGSRPKTPLLGGGGAEPALEKRFRGNALCIPTSPPPLGWDSWSGCHCCSGWCCPCCPLAAPIPSVTLSSMTLQPERLESCLITASPSPALSWSASPATSRRWPGGASGVETSPSSESEADPSWRCAPLAATWASRS